MPRSASVSPMARASATEWARRSSLGTTRVSPSSWSRRSARRPRRVRRGAGVGRCSLGRDALSGACGRCDGHRPDPRRVHEVDVGDVLPGHRTGGTELAQQHLLQLVPRAGPLPLRRPSPTRRTGTESELLGQKTLTGSPCRARTIDAPPAQDTRTAAHGGSTGSITAHSSSLTSQAVRRAIARSHHERDQPSSPTPPEPRSLCKDP